MTASGGRSSNIPTAPVVEIHNIVFSWPKQAPVIDIAEFSMTAGERVFLAGPSGSGKSTLLGLLGGVLEADAGSISIMGENLSELRTAERDRKRADYIGFIFQLFNLLPYLNVIDNVTLPCRFSARRRARALKKSTTLEQEATRLLEHLEISPELAARKATELSIGQQQRVAAARALIGAPELLIADEPTSALDQDLRTRFIDLLLAECTAANSAVLFVSHDRSIGSLFDKQIELGDLNKCVAGHE